jgi:RNA polymerase sigma factor (sigma-70 family)
VLSNHHHTRAYVDALDASRPRSAELERLVGAAADGDASALTALVERFRARVSRIARRHHLGTYDVEEVVQQTWVQMLEHIESIREPRAVGAWLETIARRESLQLLRAGDRVRPSDDELLGEAPWGNECTLEAIERRDALAAALERLTDRQRALLEKLYDEAEPSYAEISDALGIPVGSIGPTRARALEILARDATLARALR